MLESKRVDPEVFLQNLGFARNDPSLIDRLPARFFTQQRDQVLTDHFLSQHPELKLNEDTEAIAGQSRLIRTCSSLLKWSILVQMLT